MSLNLTWMARAACRDVDPELFFPTADDDGPARTEQEMAAKRVCAGCPVRASCLDFALDALPYGVVGGYSAPERRTIRRDRTGDRTPGRDTQRRDIQGRDRGVGGVA